ncbi:hypothetical protein J8J14_07940 [Roseomonas sp. SSH11]|uniref:LPS-assembly lipoprotein n=1 Tax=Pararoseomonas baculiformis TaxID=2820812 RepID=A0ABS4ACG7_9PROT|nr:LPS assembly lipoprotein LptE [Pararoseomonas baculiformis]MBP0444712.1 hypothetical protein [Pararoseomonas baculiformis]
MSERPLPRRSLLLAGLAASLGGCGFRPLYGPSEAGQPAIAPQLASVRVGRLTNRTGQLLHQALERRLAAADRSGPAARYELTVVPQTAYEAQGYRRDGAPSRFRMVMTAPWTLQTIGVPPRPVANGNARAIDAYNYLDNEYFASLLSSEAAERRLVEQVAQDIVTRLAIAFRENPPA